MAKSEAVQPEAEIEWLKGIAEKGPFYLMLAKEESDVSFLFYSIQRMLKANEFDFYIYDVEEHGKILDFIYNNSASLFAEHSFFLVEGIEALSADEQVQLFNFLQEGNKVTLIAQSKKTLGSELSLLTSDPAHSSRVINYLSEAPWNRKSRISTWVSHYLKRRRMNITQTACELLLDGVGLDRWMILQELEKLMAYHNYQGEVTAKTIELLSPQISSATVWPLFDAILMQKSKEVLRLLKRILQHDSDCYSLIALLRTQWQNYLLLLESGGGNTKVLAYLKGKRRDQLVQTLSNYSQEALRKGLLMIHRLQDQVKAESVPAPLLIQTGLLLSRPQILMHLPVS